MLREQTLEKQVHDLEVAAETKAHTKEDKARHIKLMEVRNDVKRKKKAYDTHLGYLNISVNLRNSKRQIATLPLCFTGQDYSAGVGPG